MGSHPSATLYYGFRFKAFDGTAANDWDDAVNLRRPWRFTYGQLVAAGYDEDDFIVESSDTADAIAIASGVTERVEWADQKKNPEQHAAWSAWLDRVRAAENACPVELLCAGYDGDLEYHLALKSSVQYAHDYEVEEVDASRYEPESKLGIVSIRYAMDREKAQATLIEWADKLGIPREIRGGTAEDPNAGIGWHMFATYG